MNIDDIEGLDATASKEIEELEKVTREKDGDEAFAMSRFHIFKKTYLLEEYEIGIKALKGIKKTDRIYHHTRLMLAGIYLHREDNLDLAFETVKCINEINDFNSLNFILLKIALLYIRRSESGDINKAKIALNLCKSTHFYEYNCYSKICRLLEDSKTKKIGECYLSFFEVLLETYQLLVIDYTDTERDSPERKLAHYTNTEVANILLNKEGKLNNHKYLRLNTISNVNDPSEGQLLDVLLSNKNANYSKSDFSKDFHAFISCFTLNHDSLNQFRLYGKKDNKEASGISMVFKKEFFQKNPVGGMSFLSISSSKENMLEQKNVPIDENLNKYLVMRCVYVDPKSNYIQLAQRDRLTFYREFNNKDMADEKWETYQIDIKEKTENFESYVSELKILYKKLINEKQSLDKTNIDVLYCENLLDEVVLPLKYLIKHSAFQEEQERRIIYVTSLNDPKVQMVYGEALYVEYEADVKTHLDKIYIAPAATQYQPYLAKLLCNTDVKIELSNNPYRQT